MKKPRAVLLACLALLPFRAHGAADAFLCFPAPGANMQLVGESTDTQYRNCFQFEDVAYSAFLDGGQATMRDFRFTKKFDSSSVSLRRALVDRTLLTSATFYQRLPTTGVTLLKVRFLESRISSVAVAYNDAGDVGDETISFSAERVESSFQPVDAGGNAVGQPVVTCWDIGAGTNTPGSCP